MCVATAWRSIFDPKISANWLLYGSSSHVDLQSIPVHPSASIICAKCYSINIFWFRVFHGAKLFQFFNIKWCTTSIFYPKGCPCIYCLHIHPDFSLTIHHSIYIWDFLNCSLFIYFVYHIFLPIHQLHPYWYISGLIYA